MTSEIRYTWQLKKVIHDRYHDDIGFFRSGKHVIVYSHHVNPCQYSVSTLKGFGLRYDDFIRYFAKLVKRNIPKRTDDAPKFPYSPSELAEEIMKGPMCILFNTIFMTLHDSMRKNEYGYAVA